MQTAGFVSCRKIGPSNSINRAKFHCEFAGYGHIRKYVRHTKTYVHWKAIRTCKDKKEAVDKINFLTNDCCSYSNAMNGTGLSIEILFRELPDGARQVRRVEVITCKQPG